MGAAAVWVAGVRLGDIDRHFAWQAWHFAASIVTFAWQEWHLWHWAGSSGALGSRLALWAPPLFAWQASGLTTSTVTLRGRRGTSRHRPSLWVAGVALRNIDRHFAWQAWHFATSIVTLRGRRGTFVTGLGAWFPFGAVGAAAVCVAGTF